jgi:predicted RNA-binding protein Jag
MSDYGSYGRSERPRGGRASGARYGGGRFRGADSRGGRGRYEGGRHGSRNGGARGGRGRHTHQQCPPELREVFMEARDFLAGLIRTFGLPARLSYGGIEPARDGQQITVDIRGLNGPADRPRGRDSRDYEPDADDLGMLIGKHGATLDALTAITNAVMHRGESEGLFFAVDVEGYRARRLSTLRSIALRSGDRALREGVAIELAPMPPSERRIVHLTLASNPDLATESTGTGINRRVVIVPRGFPPPRPQLDEAEGDY